MTAAAAGYDPRAGVTLWQKMLQASKGAPPQWLVEEWQQVVHPDDLPAVQSAWEAARAGTVEHSVEARIRRADGAWRWMLVHAVPFPGPDGSVAKWMGTNTDIHAIRQWIEAMRTSEERFRLLAREHAGDMSVAKEAALAFDGAVRNLRDAWNAGMEQRLSVKPQNDLEGVLQDVHWAVGSFGYFPSYALGSFIAAQLHETLRTQSEHFDAEIASVFPSFTQLTKLSGFDGIEIFAAYNAIVDQFEGMRQASGCPDDDGGPMEVHRSHEYGSTIIHSVVTGTPSVVARAPVSMPCARSTTTRTSSSWRASAGTAASTGACSGGTSAVNGSSRCGRAPPISIRPVVSSRSRSGGTRGCRSSATASAA